MKKPMMTTKEISEAGVTRIVMPEEVPYNPPGTEEFIREGARKNSELIRKWEKAQMTKLERQIKELQKANSILRAAMYDIHEYDTDGDECSVCGQMAEKALTASSLDEKGTVAAPSNTKNIKTGAELIADERARVISKENFTPKDDHKYQNDELLQAACVYISASSRFELGVDASWPFDAEWFKPTTRVRNLVKAGQFIAAEIDRLQSETDQGEAV